MTPCGGYIYGGWFSVFFITIFAADEDVATAITVITSILLLLLLSYATETCYNRTDCRIGESQQEDIYSNTIS